MKNNSVLGTWKRLLSYSVGKHKIIFSTVMVCIMISAITVVASSLYLRTLIDDYITPLLTESNPSFDKLWRSILFIGGIYLVGTLATYIYNRLMVNISQGTLKKIRDDMFVHMEKLPIRYFDTHTRGDIMSHYTNDTDALRQFVSQSLPQFVSAIVTIIVVFAAMIANSPVLTLVILIFTVVMVLVTQKVGGASAKYFMRQQESTGNITGFIEEMVNGQKVIKVFCHEEKVKEGFDKQNQELCKNSTEAFKYGNVLMPIIMQLGNLQYILLALVGGMLAINGFASITVGLIIAFINLSKAFCMPISQISQQVSMMAMALAGAERIFALIDEDMEEDQGYVTLIRAKYGEDKQLKETNGTDGIWAWKHPHDDGAITLEPLIGEIQFFDVDFGYTERKLVLKNIDLYAKKGQKIAFVGATGAGKTTITNLINRFYDLDDGKIRYDGININKIKKPDLRRSLGVVLQDVNLFTGTVLDNIRYGKLEASDEDCINAAKLTNAHGFISRLKDGYNTILSENGAGLSQGQRQLISIARAAVADPPAMVLDEATSSIDTRTELIVQSGMDKLMEGRTVFVIAHRLSTVKNSDVIMVLEQGRIMERGDHEGLIEKKGVYYRLYTGAFELE